jgi:hypothetical protein
MKVNANLLLSNLVPEEGSHELISSLLDDGDETEDDDSLENDTGPLNDNGTFRKKPYWNWSAERNKVKKFYNTPHVCLMDKAIVLIEEIKYVPDRRHKSLHATFRT